MRVREGHYWIYRCSPIDWWEGWSPIDRSTWASEWRDEGNDAHELDALVAGVQQTARFFADILAHVGWEGDGDWRIAPLPDPEFFDCAIMFAVKQGNNGTTFLITPRRFPWLRLEASADEFGPILWTAKEGADDAALH